MATPIAPSGRRQTGSERARLHSTGRPIGRPAARAGAKRTPHSPSRNQSRACSDCQLLATQLIGPKRSTLNVPDRYRQYVNVTAQFLALLGENRRLKHLNRLLAGASSGPAPATLPAAAKGPQNPPGQPAGGQQASCSRQAVRCPRFELSPGRHRRLAAREPRPKPPARLERGQLTPPPQCNAAVSGGKAKPTAPMPLAVRPTCRHSAASRRLKARQSQPGEIQVSWPQPPMAAPRGPPRPAKARSPAGGRFPGRSQNRGPVRETRLSAKPPDRLPSAQPCSTRLGPKPTHQHPDQSATRMAAPDRNPARAPGTRAGLSSVKGIPTQSSVVAAHNSQPMARQQAVPPTGPPPQTPVAESFPAPRSGIPRDCPQSWHQRQPEQVLVAKPNGPGSVQRAVPASGPVKRVWRTTQPALRSSPCLVPDRLTRLSDSLKSPGRTRRCSTEKPPIAESAPLPRSAPGASESPAAEAASSTRVRDSLPPAFP